MPIEDTSYQIEQIDDYQANYFSAPPRVIKEHDFTASMNDHQTTLKEKVKGIGQLKKLDSSKFSDSQDNKLNDATLSCSM